jgi:hypothetical protein
MLSETCGVGPLRAYAALAGGDDHVGIRQKGVLTPVVVQKLTTIHKGGEAWWIYTRQGELHHRAVRHRGDEGSLPLGESGIRSIQLSTEMTSGMRGMRCRLATRIERWIGAKGPSKFIQCHNPRDICRSPNLVGKPRRPKAAGLTRSAIEAGKWGRAHIRSNMHSSPFPHPIPALDGPYFAAGAEPTSAVFDFSISRILVNSGLVRPFSSRSSKSSRMVRSQLLPVSAISCPTYFP